MAINKITDDVVRTPFNIRADFRKVDNDFRERLDALVPDDLASRIKEIRAKRLAQETVEDEQDVA